MRGDGVEILWGGSKHENIISLILLFLLPLEHSIKQTKIVKSCVKKYIELMKKKNHIQF